MKKPYFPFYPGDYLSDTLGLSCCQHGVYLLLLAVSWQRGPLPDDMDHLARLAANPPIEALRFILENYWTLEERGWINQRLELERKILAEKFSKRSEAGKKAIDARWSKTRKIDTNRIPIVEQSYTNQNQNQNHIQNQKQSQNQDTPQTPQGGHTPETPSAEAREDPQPLPAETPKTRKTRVNGKKPEIWDQAETLLAHLSAKTGSNFKFRNHKGEHTAAATLAYERIEEHGLDDMLAVVDHKIGEWEHNSDMRKYLRPATLFAKGKAEQYVGQIGNGGNGKGEVIGGVFVPDYTATTADGGSVIEGEFRHEAC